LFDQVGRPLTFFGSAGSHPGAMYLPAGITVHEGDLDLFQQFVHPAFKAERLIIVSNQFGTNKISVYAFGQLAPGKTVADISASKGVVPGGTGDSKIAPMPTPTTAPSDEEGLIQPTPPVAAKAPATAPSVSSTSAEGWQRK
jgi:hypothetical protein